MPVTANMMNSGKEVRVIDLFCGIGGLTHGLRKSGLNVVAGVDNDERCQFGYEYNNKVPFIHEDIFNVTPRDIKRLFGRQHNSVRVLVGCAPCQPFSKLNINRKTKKEYQALEKFAELIAEVKPDIVSMENVSGLGDVQKYPVFGDFLDTLDANGFQYDYDVIDASDYGVPQRRMRLVLLASRFGPITLVPPTHKYRKRTVRNAIYSLEPIRHGETSPRDSLHRARRLSPTNERRIKATPKNGGNSTAWDDDLQLECHKRETGITYRHTVYARMHWDEPGPTITTQSVGLGNGRFGHPSQDRAISLREAALLQTFPRSYRFVESADKLFTAHVATFIGNAVPVRLGVIIGRSITKHVREYA